MENSHGIEPARRKHREKQAADVYAVCRAAGRSVQDLSRAMNEAGGAQPIEGDEDGADPGFGLECAARVWRDP